MSDAPNPEAPLSDQDPAAQAPSAAEKTPPEAEPAPPVAEPMPSAAEQTPPPAPSQPVTPATTPTPARAGGMDDSVAREVAEAMQAMSERDLADLTVGGPATSDSPASGVQLGRIEAVRGDDVFISLGGKSQGVLSRSQFKPDETLAVGEPVEVFVDRYDRDSDLLILSRKGQARSAEWDTLRPGDLVEGRIIGLNRGGLEVQLKGLQAFMPASQVDVMHVKDISIFLNEVVQCEVLEIDRKGRRMTVSRRKVLEKERALRRDELLSELEAGQVRKGVVGNITDFGAFVDLGGVDGLVHISDLSWSQVKHPSEVVQQGDVIEVKVLRIQDDKEGKKRISLGLKQAMPDPWDQVAEQFPVGSTQRVRIVRLADFGAFAQLTDGIEGLIPISEMSWGRIGRPSEVVEVGKTIDAAVIRVEPKRRRIALSIKQATPDPWAGVMESYAPDSMVAGTVTKLMDFGAFVQLAPGVEGLVHISELADHRVKSCGEIVKVGQEVNARVLNVDPKSRRISLSLKPAASAKAHDAAASPTDFGKAPPKKRDRKLRGGLSSDWDWTGLGLDGVPKSGRDAARK